MKAYSNSYPPPLKSVLIFDFKYENAKNLEEVDERLKDGYYILLPRKDILVMRSLGEEGPTKVIFLLLEKNEKGGEIILVTTKDSGYSYEKLLLGMNVYCKRAGITCKSKADPNTR